MTRFRLKIGNDHRKRPAGDGGVVKDHDSGPPEADQTAVNDVFVENEWHLDIVKVDKEPHESDPELRDQDNGRMKVLADQFHGEGIEADEDHGEQRKGQIIHFHRSFPRKVA